MQTAYNIFKAHPQFETIKFVMVPKLRECMNLASGIPCNIEKVIEEFSELFPILDSSLFDSYDDKLHYFLADTDQSLREEVTPLIEPKEDDVMGDNTFDLLLERSKAVKPHKLESKLNILQRVNMVKDYVGEYAKSVPEDQKVVVVSHFFIFEMWTGQWEGSPYDAELKDCKKPTKYINFKNSMPYYYTLNETKDIEQQVVEEKAKE